MSVEVPGGPASINEKDLPHLAMVTPVSINEPVGLFQFPIPPAGPANTVLPVITGTIIVGNTLTATAGTWTGAAPITYTYQWKRAGSNISSATASTYLLVEADSSTIITCAVTASNVAGSVSVASVGVGPITSALIPATLAIFIGQSNARGWSNDPVNTTSITNGTGYEFYPVGASGVLLPLGNNLMGRNEGGPQRAFVATWGVSGGTVICVDIGISGASMDMAVQTTQTGSGPTLSGGTWDLSAGASSLYNLWANTLIQRAIAVVTASGFDIKKKVVVWVQGEQDAGAAGLTNGTIYATKLTAFIDKFVADFAINGFLISALGIDNANGNTSYHIAIRNAQSTAAAARPAVAQIAYAGAVNFGSSGMMVDNLHYTQAGYNLVGTGVATSGLAFVGNPSYAPGGLAKFNEIAGSPPAIAGWQRLRLTTSRSGSFGPQFYSDPSTPYATTWIDTSGANPTSAAQSLTWSFPSTASKQVYCYVSDQIGSNGQLAPAGNTNFTAMTVLDAGLKMATLNFGSGADIAPSFVMSAADLAGFDVPTLTFISMPGPSSIVWTNANTAHFTALTYLNISQSLTAVLDVTLNPNLTRLDISQVGLSVANVNSILVGMDANGRSSGTLYLNQFRSSPSIAAAPPSGAGVTAKTSLIGKGWSVTTD